MTFSRAIRPAAWSAFLAAVALCASRAEAGKTTRISLGPSKLEADQASFDAAPSASGRYVAFASLASNLVSGDGTRVLDVFVRDRGNGKVHLVSVGASGIAVDGHSQEPAISANGRFVAFRSTASNLVSDDANGFSDVFVRDRKKGRTRRISVDSSGVEANGASFQLSISANGRYVVFESVASNLIAGDGNGTGDIFVHDRHEGLTRRVSVSSAGAESNGDSARPRLSANGRFVAYSSDAFNLVEGDGNDEEDVFLTDLKTGKTRRVSVASSGLEADDDCNNVAVSADGRNAQPDVFAHDRK